MSVNTEPMNLKDAFAYMNFLSTSMPVSYTHLTLPTIA